MPVTKFNHSLLRSCRRGTKITTFETDLEIFSQNMEIKRALKIHFFFSMCICELNGSHNQKNIQIKFLCNLWTYRLLLKKKKKFVEEQDCT